MAIVVNDRERIGEEKLGVLFDGGKVRRRREWARAQGHAL